MSRVRSALRRLGVRYVRDSVFANPAPRLRAFDRAQDDRLLALAREGIRADLVSGQPGTSTQGSPAQVADHVAAHLRPAVASIEGPNEFDGVGGADWVTRLRRYQAALFRAVRRRPALRRVPVLGPSFLRTDSDRRFGSMAGIADALTVHPYPGGNPPETAGGLLALGANRTLARLRGVTATETGYHDAMHDSAATQSPVPDDVAARYVPRLVLEALRRGVQRVYLYELLDQSNGGGQERHFGLFRVDGTPKPAARALSRLLAAARSGGDADARPASVRTRRAPAGTRTFQIMRADGRQVVFLWRPVSLWNAETRRRATPPAPAGVRLNFDAGVDGLSVEDLATGRRESHDDGADGVTVALGADPVAVSFDP